MHGPTAQGEIFSDIPFILDLLLEVSAPLKIHIEYFKGMGQQPIWNGSFDWQLEVFIKFLSSTNKL